MGGGLMQLVAYGAQDIYLTGNPQITFFKVVYRRHTNFSMESIEQTVNGSNTLVNGSTSNGTVTVSRNGDLLGKMYVRCDQDANQGIQGDQLIRDVTLEIGGQQIDKHDWEWMQVWTELTTPESKAAGHKYLTGSLTNSLVTAGETSQQSIMFPLQFYFCRNPGLALPLIALQYHEVKVILNHDWTQGFSGLTSNRLWADYIYLDTEERRRFAQVSHEYLIEQLQYQTEGSSKAKVKLNFNHPVKELIWTDAGSITTQTAKLTLNGHDRFSTQNKEYFQLRQPVDHHTAVPKQNLPSAAQLTTLDRQTQFGFFSDTNAAITGALTLEHSAATANGDTDEIRFFDEAGTFTFKEGHAPAAGAIQKGDQIAFVFTVGGATAGTMGTAGRTYFSTALADSTLVNTSVGKCSITTPTTADATPLTLSATADTNNNGRVFMFKVTNGNSAQSRTSQQTRNINVYSFALKPEEHQPSGTCNFSRIDTAHLEFSSAVTVQNVYAVNYNVLRVMSGMGGLAYSN